MRNTPHQLRARRCLLAVAGALGLSPIAGTLLIDRCPMSARFPEANTIVERWRSRVPPPQIVFFGSSRTAGAVGEREIESIMKRRISVSPPVFNAAVSAGDPVAMRYMAAHLFSTGPAPRLVILEVTPQSVARRQPFLELLITRQFTMADILAYGGDIFRPGQKAVSRLLSSRLTPFYRHRAHLLAWAEEATGHLPVKSGRDSFSGPLPATAIQPAPMPPPASQPATPPPGVERRETPFPPSVRAEPYLAGVRKRLADYEVAGRASEALEQLVASCRKKNVRVILLQVPVYSGIRVLLKPEVIGKYRAFIQRIEGDYGCRFVDVSERVSDSMFKDPEHLNSEGGEVFSRTIAEEILLPFWRAEMQRSDER